LKLRSVVIVRALTGQNLYTSKMNSWLRPWPGETSQTCEK